MSILQRPTPLSPRDQAVYAAIEAGDETAFWQHFPQMCVSNMCMAHVLALGIVHDSNFVWNELVKGSPHSKSGSRLHPAFTHKTINEAVNLALDQQRWDWVTRLFQTQEGPYKGLAVTFALENMARQGREKEVRFLLDQELPYAEGSARFNPLRAAITHNQLPLVSLLWAPLGGRHFPHWTTHLVVDALADHVSPAVRAQVFSLSDDNGLLQTTLVNAAMKDRVVGLNDWWQEVQRRQLNVSQADVNFALVQAAEQGAQRSVAFLLNTLTPTADPNAENGRALQEAVARGHEGISKLLLPRVDVVTVCKAMVRRKKLPSGDSVSPADNWAQVDQLTQWASPEQQESLKQQYGSRLKVTLALDRAKQAEQVTPLGARRRFRS